MTDNKLFRVTVFNRKEKRWIEIEVALCINEFDIAKRLAQKAYDAKMRQATALGSAVVVEVRS